MLYSQEDLTTARAQIRKVLILLAIPCVLLFAVLVYSLVIRLEWLTIASTILMGATALFVYGIFLSPLRAYKNHLLDMLNGRSREMTGVFDHMESHTAMVEGVMYYPLYMNVDEHGSEDGIRLLYFDASKPQPEWSEGDRLTFHVHDKSVVRWEKA